MTVRSSEGVDYERNVTEVKQLVRDPEPAQSQTTETHDSAAASSTSVAVQPSASVPGQLSVPDPVTVQTDRP